MCPYTRTPSTDKRQPPRLATWLLERRLTAEAFEIIAGDLDEGLQGVATTLVCHTRAVVVLADDRKNAQHVSRVGPHPVELVRPGS